MSYNIVSVIINILAACVVAFACALWCHPGNCDRVVDIWQRRARYLRHMAAARKEFEAMERQVAA